MDAAEIGRTCGWGTLALINAGLAGRRLAASREGRGAATTQPGVVVLV